MKKIFIYLDITHFKPYVYSTLYIGNIVLFSLIYTFIFSNDFKLEESMTYIQALYFSIVTVTTLGYGDILPKLNSSFLLSVITLQVMLGIMLIGLFLNSLSHKLSEKKDEQREIEENRINANNLTKLLTILKPNIESYLSVLSETYKVTADREQEPIEIAPNELFNQKYYDQISRQNFLSNETRYGSDKMTWGHFILDENKKFVKNLDNFLNKFATSLPIEIIEIIVNLINHRFLTHAEQALSSHQFQMQNKLNPRQIDYLSIEHSSVAIPNKQESIKEFHQTLLKLISHINNSLDADTMKMTIYLKNGTAPPVGSAKGDIIEFGPFKD